MRARDRIAAPLLAASIAAAGVSSAPAPARADDGYIGHRTGLSFGIRGSYYRRDGSGAGSGAWSPGAQLRMHVAKALAIEGSADYREEEFGGSKVDVYPVQASLLVYLVPESRLSPYLLGGGGWYYTNVKSTNSTRNRFAPHGGAGLEWFMDHHWSLDASYRYVWNEDLEANDALGRRTFSDRGHMGTVGLNYRF